MARIGSLRRILAAGAALALVACADDFVADPDTGLDARVEAVDWPGEPILLGETLTLRVRVEDVRSGAQVEPDGIEWTVLPGFGAVVEHAAGDSIVLRAVSLVDLRITAALLHDAFDTASVSDTLPVHLNGIEMDAAPVAPLDALGDTVTIEVRGLDVNGQPVEVPGWTWRVNGTAATIPSSGADAVRATAVGNGRAWIVASHPLCSGHCADSVAIDVAQVAAQLAVTPSSAALTWIGDTAHLTATLRDENGHPVAGSVTWGTTAAGTATVEAGVVRAVGNGVASIFAHAGPLADSVEIGVEQMVAHIQLTAPDTVEVGDTLQLSAVVQDSGGTVVEGVTATWSTSDSAVVSLSATGRVVARARGIATIRASAQDVLSSTTVMVAAWALAFDGDDYVEVPLNPALVAGDPFTIEAWVRPHGASPSAALVAIWGGTKTTQAYGLYLQGLVPTVMLRGGAGANTVGTLASPAVISTNAWHHIAFVYENGDGDLYVDGVLAASSQELPRDLQTLQGPLRLGADAQDTPAFLDGELDEVRIWASARTEEEIVASMSQRLAPLQNLDLRAYWPLSEGSGDPLSLVGGMIGILGGTTGAAARPTWTTEASPAP